MSVSESPILEASCVDFFYGDFKALININMAIARKQVTALIGPSGCGKSTFLRCLNRMHETGDTKWRLTGKILYDGNDIYSPTLDVVNLRTLVGMVFQKSTAFSKSIYDNVAYGLTIQRCYSKEKIEEIVTASLQRAGLWSEVKDRLRFPGDKLSGGQQQRLCIARALAVSPEVLLMDEPCSALDPASTTRIEDLIQELKESVTVVIVTHNMEQARRISDRTAFFLHGELVEYNNTAELFLNPKDHRTLDYVRGNFG